MPSYIELDKNLSQNIPSASSAGKVILYVDTVRGLMVTDENKNTAPIDVTSDADGNTRVGTNAGSNLTDIYTSNFFGKICNYSILFRRGY
jgi:hypothetical protein